MNKRMVLLVTVLMLAMGFAQAGRIASGQSGTFRVVGNSYVVIGSNLYHLDDSNVPYGWKLLPYATYTLPPIPIASIISYDGVIAITDAGEGWAKIGPTWTDLGSIPGTPTVQTTWGQVKDRYRR